MSEEAANIFGLGTGFGIFILFLGILWWVLCIVLFFKIWGMTNDVSEIKGLLKEQLDLEHPYVENDESTKNKTA